MATVRQASLAEIYLAIQAQLVASLGWPIVRVIIDTDGDEEFDETHFQADQVVFLQKSGQGTALGFEGMGRHWAPENVRLHCRLYTRVDLDARTGYAIGLTDETLGHEPAALAIRNALFAFQPIDASNNWLVQEPIEPAGGWGPRRRDREDKMWAKSSIDFNMVYAPLISQSYQ